MQRLTGIVLALAFAAWPLHPRAEGDLMSRMIALNPNLRSFTATMRAHVALTTFPFLSTDIVATYYHKDPDMDKLEVQSGLPALAQGFSKLYAHIEPPALWQKAFVVTKGPDNGKTTVFTLVPRVQGNVARIVVTVDDASATMSRIDWTFANGGTASVNEHYSQVDGDTVVTAQSGQVSEPGYTGTITTTISDYKMNPQLSDALFSE
jgi:outer membrane lipoprotein-sorting protein